MSADSRDPGYITGPITLSLLILITLLVIRGLKLPPVSDQEIPTTEFSTARAMRDVRAIARAPHPLGSIENNRVREYLLVRLRELGANPEVQTVTAARTHRSAPDTWARANNIVGRIPGTNSSGAIMLAAHYDSVPSGPGAGDDAASVAAILETIRALKAGGALRNDLIVLFSDGEELGMIGAQGFVENYPAAHDVKEVLNFEMRGDEGMSVLFQTNARAAWLIDQFAAVAPVPRATSAGAPAYRLMPNDTDLTVFLENGMAGMNFAASGGLPRYHTMLDNPDLLDKRTIQHQGSYVLSMARRLGAVALDDPRRDDEVYFVVGATMVHYVTRLAIPLAILVALLVAGVIGIGVHSGRFSVAGIGGGVALYAAAIVVAMVEARGVWSLMAALEGYRMLPSGAAYGGFYYTLAALALIFGTMWALYALASRWVRAQNLGAGALVVWTIMMIETSSWLPGVSYILTWPLLFAAFAIGLGSGATNGHVTIRPAVLALVGLVPGTAMFVPSLVLSTDGTIIFLMLTGAGAALLFGLYVPYTDFLTSGRRWTVPIALGLLTIGMIVKGHAASNFDALHPHPDSIFYILDSDSEQARWGCLDLRPDRFTAQFFQHHVRAGWLARLTGLATDDTPADTLAKIPRGRAFAGLNDGRTIEGDAPLIKALPPVLRVIDDTTRDGERVVKMHIASARNASAIWMSVPVGIRVLGNAIDGKSAGKESSDGWAGWYWNAPSAGFDLELEVATEGPFVVTVIDQTAGLPTIPGFKIAPRGADMMPTPFLFFDSATLIRRTYPIGGERLTRR